MVTPLRRAQLPLTNTFLVSTAIETRRTRRRSLSHPLAVLFTGLGLWALPPIHAIDCSSNFVSAVPAPTATFLRGYWGPLHGPAGLTVTADGTLFVADPGRGVVVERSFDGRLEHEWRGFAQPVAVAVAADRTEPIFVADQESGEVVAVDRTFAASFALGQGPGEFTRPSDIAVESGAGRIFVSDAAARTVSVFDASGARLATLSGAPGDPFLSPTGIALDPASGEIAVSDQIAFRIHVFGPDLAWRRCLGRQGSKPGRFGYPFGLAFDKEGRLYVADAFQGRVQVIDDQGGHVAYIGEFGSRPGQLRGIGDLAIDPHGRLFTSSLGNARLDQFGLDGFTDPERFGPLAVDVESERVSAAGPDPVRIRLLGRGYDLAPVPLADISINGIHPVTSTTGASDAEGNFSLLIEVELASLLSTLPADGPAEIVAEIAAGGLALVGADRVVVESFDSDGDGIDDSSDLCPATVPGNPVDDTGCSIDQLCPCPGPWSRPGSYLRCMVRTSGRFLREARISPRERRSILEHAASSSCARTPTDRRRKKP